MPRIEATVEVPLPVDLAFRLSQSQGELRYRWDPFVHSQRLLDGAELPDRGVRTLTRSRHGLGRDILRRLPSPLPATTRRSWPRPVASPWPASRLADGPRRGATHPGG